MAETQGRIVGELAEVRSAAVARPFGEANRARLIDQWFTNHTPTSATAWEHVYQLLLWIDTTTGLAHCYESDKSQPGRAWYARSLAFHAWVAARLGCTPASLAGDIDWLFKRAIADLADLIRAERDQLLATYERQRAPYKGQGFPAPGDNPELLQIIYEELHPFLAEQPPAEVWRSLTERIVQHLSQENKRKNLVGEGFEDVLAALIVRLPVQAQLVTTTRTKIQVIPGFNPPRGRDKNKKVDLVILRGQKRRRVLVTAKWSVRADREEQFAQDFAAYVALEAAGEPFDYVLVTNEFDPARLVAACERLAGNQPLFTRVVHVNPEGLRAAYGPDPARSAARVVEHITHGRLVSLETWLTEVTAAL